MDSDHRNQLNVVAAVTSYDTVTIHLSAQYLDDNCDADVRDTNFVQLPSPFDDTLVKCTLNCDWFLDVKVFVGLNKQIKIDLNTSVIKNGAQMKLESSYRMNGSISGKLDANKLMEFIHEDNSMHFQCQLSFRNGQLFEKYAQRCNAYENGSNADITVLTEHQPLNANCSVLMSKSKAFAELIATTKDEGVISLPEDYQSLSELIFAMLTGHARLADVNSALKLFEIATVYGVDDIKKQCFVFLCRQMSPASVNAIYQQSEIKPINKIATETKVLNESEENQQIDSNNLDQEQDFKQNISQDMHANVKLHNCNGTSPTTSDSDARSNSYSIEVVSTSSFPSSAEESDSICIVEEAESVSSGDGSRRTSISSIVALGEESTSDEYTFVDRFANCEPNTQKVRNKCATLKIEELERFFINEIGADVMIKIDGIVIRVSRFFLVTKSPVFAELLKDSNEIMITNVDPDVMKIVLKALYTGYVEINDVLFALRIIKLAESYKIDFIVQQAEDYIKQAQEQK